MNHAAPFRTERYRPAEPEPRFKLIGFKDVLLNTTANYLVKELIARTGLSVIWGPPKCGKSFWAADLGLHIALGWEYRGRRVHQATVVYIVLEGRHGFPTRIEAFKQHYGVLDAPFHLLLTKLDLIADASALITDIKKQLAQIGVSSPGIVFIDTLNRSLVGSESKDEDMGRYLAAAERVAEELDCAVAIVHHCGIDRSRPRGHTSLSGSVESQLSVIKSEDGEVVVTVELAKDFAEGAEIRSRLELIEVGKDDDGDPITSLIVIPEDGQPSSKPKRIVKGAKKVALDILRKAIDEAGSIHPASNHIPPNTRTISIETWRKYAYLGTISKSDKPDAKQKAFVRAVQDLQEAKLIGIWGDYAWIV